MFSVGIPNSMALIEATWRFAVSESENFAHLENPKYIAITRDQQLRRNLVELKNVCWLDFNKKLGMHASGLYQV